MSLRPNGLTQIPNETLRVARAAFPKRCLAMRARDALGPLFTDEQFAELFAARGRPAWSPARLALVLVLQFVEGLTDRQAADAVRARLDWKYALDRMEAGVWLVDWRLELTRSGLCWRIHTGDSSARSRVRREAQVPPGGMPLNQASTRTRLRASAVSTCCRWVLARPR